MKQTECLQGDGENGLVYLIIDQDVIMLINCTSNLFHRKQ